MSSDIQVPPVNPMDLTDPLNAEQAAGTFDELPNPVSTSQVHDSAVSRAEKFERPRMSNERQDDESPPSKRVKLESPLSESIKFEANGDLSPKTTPSERQKGVAPIKAECVQMRLFPPTSLTILIDILCIHLGAEKTKAPPSTVLILTDMCLM